MYEFIASFHKHDYAIPAILIFIYCGPALAILAAVFVNFWLGLLICGGWLVLVIGLITGALL